MKFYVLRIITSAIVTLSLLIITGCDGDDGNDGTNGRVGASGNDGANGNNGLSSLIMQTSLAVGNENCPVGGVLIESGIDLDSNNILDSNEVSDSNHICDGSAVNVLNPALVAEGREIFRFDTFNDETLWTDVLKINEVIESSVSPATALSVGLKVDSEMLPPGILDTADLTDPATTLTLIRLNAVVGIQGIVENINGVDRLTSVGVTCALCHSDVDNAVAPGIGKRLDGWPNRELNPGLILSLSPALQAAEAQAVLSSWGPGKYDAYWNQDGLNDPTIIPPAYGFNGIHLATFTGEGDISYWNAYVAITQMGGQGNFRDDDLNINIQVDDDQVTGKLEALANYQWSLLAPRPASDSFDPQAAGRGKVVFEGQGRCANCHAGSMFTDANSRLHDPSEVGTDPTLASRSKTGQYRTTPLAGVWHRAPYFHNGSAATLNDVVIHYDTFMGLDLSGGQQDDLVEYLKSL